MKNLMELTEASSDDLPDIYCDLDMVLVDFMKGADEVSGGSFVTTDKEERWKILIRLRDFGQI